MSRSLRGKEIWILVGTRPEVIKQMPLYLACVKRFGKSKVALIGTGQHRELLDLALKDFGAKLDRDLGIMKKGQSLIQVCQAVLGGMEKLFLQSKPRWLVVQGDTASAAMAAWAGFLHHVPIAHNEAGLRTYDLKNPFPEEANRKIISAFADLHLAPTAEAKRALVSEGIRLKQIRLTGNPGIDALRMTLERKRPQKVDALLRELERKKLRPVLLTAHRRENQGKGMLDWFQGLADFLKKHPDLFLIYPMHPNGAGYLASQKFFKDHPRVRVLQPFNYQETVHLLKHCAFVVTDSGRIRDNQIKTSVRKARKIL